MRLCLALLLTLMVALPAANLRAGGPDDQYIIIYGLIQEGDVLSERSETRQALAKYLEAQTALQRFQKGFPEWGEDVVKFRLNYLANQISALSSKAQGVETTAPTNAAPTTVSRKEPPPDWETQLTLLKQQLAQSAGEKSLLEAKLKEALAVQPAAVDPRELAKAEEKLVALQKENELLNATLAKEKSKPGTVDTNAVAKVQRALDDANKQLADQKQTAEKFQTERDQLQNRLKATLSNPAPDTNALNALQQNLSETSRQLSEQKELVSKLNLEKSALQSKLRTPASESESVAVLRARIDTLEAQKAPYSAEELALMKLPEPKLANVEPTKPAAQQVSPSLAPLAAEAQRLFAAGDYQKAEEKYLQVLKEKSNNPIVLANLAIIETELNHLDQAEKHIRAAIALAPEDAFNYAALGTLKLKQGQNDEAIDALSRAAKLAPQNAEIQSRLGVAFSQKGLRGPAEAALRKALQLQPGYGRAHLNLAVIYANQDPPLLELARWHYQKAIAAGLPKDMAFELQLKRAP